MHVEELMFLKCLKCLKTICSLKSLKHAPNYLLYSSDLFSILLKSGEGNGNPHQYSCLENPRDRAAWWAAIYGVTQSWTRLKRLSSSSSS